MSRDDAPPTLSSSSSTSAAAGTPGTKVWLSRLGRAVDPHEATVSVFDRGFLYGDSVYETLRTIGGHYVEWDEHIERLHRSASGIGLEIPFDDAALRAAVDEAHEASGNVDSRIRIVVTRGSGHIMLDVRDVEDPQLVVYVQRLVETAPEAYERGLSAVIVDSRASTHPGLKTGNYLPNILALQRAIEARGEDAILCNRDGEIAEGATSNIFMVEGGKVYTPELETGLLAGITRQRVIGIAARLGIELHETRILPERLREADEVFLTSSVRSIMPVTRLDGVEMSGGGPGPVTRRLMEANTAYLQGIASGGGPSAG